VLGVGKRDRGIEIGHHTHIQLLTALECRGRGAALFTQCLQEATPLPASRKCI
jgi:hypothetical protein